MKNRHSKRKLDKNNTGIYFGGEFVGFINYNPTVDVFVGLHINEGWSEEMCTAEQVYVWIKLFQYGE